MCSAYCVWILQKGLGDFSFIIFGVICLVTLIYIWIVIPETKNKTFLEISQLFAKRNGVEIVMDEKDSDAKVKDGYDKVDPPPYEDVEERATYL